MTLVVSTFWDDPETGGSIHHTDWDDGHHMAGVEAARWSLWGSAAVRRRCASFLPQLANGDLYVSPEQVPAFLAEVLMLLDDVEQLARELEQYDVSRLQHYLTNFVRAAELAKFRGGGVLID
jgi:hypothetical protein